MAVLQQTKVELTVNFMKDHSNYLTVVKQITLGDKVFELFHSYSTRAVWIALRIQEEKQAYFSCSGDILSDEKCSCFATRQTEMQRLRSSDYSCHLNDYFASHPDGGTATVKLTLKLFGSAPPPIRTVGVDYFSLESHMENWLLRGDGDVTFIVGPSKAKIRAHSSYIRHSLSIPIIHDSMLEGATKEVVIPDVDPEAFQAFLLFLYSGRVRDHFMQKHAVELLKLGDMYDIKRLRDLCQNHILVNDALNVDNVCDVLQIADTHRAPELREVCLDLFSSSQEEAMSTRGFELLPTPLVKECISESPSRKRKREEYLSAGWTLDDNREPGRPAGQRGGCDNDKEEVVKRTKRAVDLRQPYKPSSA